MTEDRGHEVRQEIVGVDIREGRGDMSRENGKFKFKMQIMRKKKDSWMQ